MSDDYKIGISRTELDAIELRLIGVDHRPWRYDREWNVIVKASRKAAKKASVAALRNPDGSPYVGRKYKDGLEPGEKEQEPVFSTREILEQLSLFNPHRNATADMAVFVAEAPEDIEKLINAVKFLQLQLERARADRDEFKKEMLSLRVEQAATLQKLTEMRAAWKNIKKAMGD